MEIIETPVFTKQVTRLLADDEYGRLQAVLVRNPEIGDLIKRGGGLRKVRWGLGDKGKRGGTRVIYYWVCADERLLMLMIYAKAESADLTDGQVRQLKKIVKEEYP